MLSTSVQNGVKVTSRGKESVNDVLTMESPLEIHINGKAFSVTMCTPGYERELARGILHSENVIAHENAQVKWQTLAIDADGYITRLNALVQESDLGFGYDSNRSLTSVSSCGICGKEDLSSIELCGNPLRDDVQFSLEAVNGMFDSMSAAQEDFKLSGGCHAAAAFKADGTLLVLREDIGRHNAVDKVIGHLINTKNLEAADALLVSGRVSYEIVSKAYYAGIPLLAAISAPSSLGVQTAEKFGVTLLGFCRSEKVTAYSRVDRMR